MADDIASISGALSKIKLEDGNTSVASPILPTPHFSGTPLKKIKQHTPLSARWFTPRGDSVKKHLALEYHTDVDSSARKRPMETKSGNSGHLWALASNRGGRHYMEDTLLVYDANGVLFVGCYDGHGGGRVSDVEYGCPPCWVFVRNRLHKSVLWHLKTLLDGGGVHALLSKEPAKRIELMEKAVRSGIQEVEEEWTKVVHGGGLKAKNTTGTTVTLALIVGKHAVFANLGDSETVLGSRWDVQCEVVSQIHSPTDPPDCDRWTEAPEKARRRLKEVEHVATKGRIAHPEGGWYEIAVSRSLGDSQFKGEDLVGFVTAEPFVMSKTLKKRHQLLVLASDGVWNCFAESKGSPVQHDDLVNLIKRILYEDALRPDLQEGSEQDAIALAGKEALEGWNSEEEGADRWETLSKKEQSIRLERAARAVLSAALWKVEEEDSTLRDNLSVIVVVLNTAQFDPDHITPIAVQPKLSSLPFDGKDTPPQVISSRSEGMEGVGEWQRAKDAEQILRSVLPNVDGGQVELLQAATLRARELRVSMEQMQLNKEDEECVVM